MEQSLWKLFLGGKKQGGGFFVFPHPYLLISWEEFWLSFVCIFCQTTKYMNILLGSGKNTYSKSYFILSYFLILFFSGGESYKIFIKCLQV